MKWFLPSLPVATALVFCCALAAYPDGRIDSNDLLNLAENWQRTGGGPGDFTGDGFVDEADVMYVIERWKEATSSTPTATVTPTPTETLPSEIVIDIPGLPARATPLIMVKIPAGSFMMGSNPGEQDSEANEVPQHQVNIGYEFYIGKYELTKAQWQALVGTTPWQAASYVRDDPNSPALYVSWYDIRNASGLLDKLNALGQGTFRLPSESEWEYCCRAGTTTSFYWGDDPYSTRIGDYAWYDGNAWSGLEPYAHRVGLKLPNAFGLYDMSGNEGEWCEDWWNDNYQRAPADGSAWTTGKAGYRVVRGGDWFGEAYRCRSAYRYRSSPDARYDGFIGVRVVRTLDGPTLKVDSVSIDTFSPPSIWRGGWFSNSGSVAGSGGATVVYHWITQKPDGSYADSGPLTVPMFNGAAAIPAYPAFPTDQVGEYQTFIRVTSPTVRESPRAFYTVTEGGPREITIDIPGLPADATPLVMVRIPAGSFMMGRYPGEQDSYSDEDPQHRVDIGYDFYMGKYELTKAQWQALMGTTPWQGQDYVLDDPNSPAVYISWYDIRKANGLLDQLNALDQGNFQLPSEAEWEYACRAGTTTRFYWGDDPGSTQIGYFAWYDTWSSGERYAHVVGLKLPNSFGLYDMSGNAYEWCEDESNHDYQGAPADGSAWTTGSANYRMVRGGHWGGLAYRCRSAFRLDRTVDPSYPGLVDPSYGSSFGLRVVRTIDSPNPKVKSVSIDTFSLPRVGQGGSVSNTGSIAGSGSATVVYHWITRKPDGSDDDSGPLRVYMANGAATIPAYTGFPTDQAGQYQSFVRVTSPSPIKESPIASYIVTEGGPQEITIDIPGLPSDATPLIMVRIPAGSFLMGRYPGEQDGYSYEDPQHQVNIGYDFYIGKCEFTKAQWQALTGTTPWQGQLYVLDDSNSPAVYVSWYDIRNVNGLLDKLNALGQGTFRLPSEAEWEYSCRAKTTTRFYWGDDPNYIQIGEFAWYTGNAWDVKEKYAHVVGLKLPNAFGLYDMSGNGYEWCEDGWNDNYQGAPADGSAWTTGDAGYRVVRGGGFDGRAGLCRSARRGYGFRLGDRSNFLGVRVVRTAGGPVVTPTPTLPPLPQIIIDIPGLPADATPLVLVKIPAGSFMMGRYPGEQDSYSDEYPQHQVNIDYDFYIGKYELTKAQWQAITGTTPWQGQSSDPNSPAVYVSWNDIRITKGLLDKLNALGQGTFRLPSEAKWEYCCRAGTATRFYWGDDSNYTQMGDYTWYKGNAWDVGERYAHVVGLKLPNAFGLYDMSGNVSEWCEDSWHGNYNGVPSDGRAWVSPTDLFRVLRGGYFNSAPKSCRSAKRYHLTPGDRYNFIGLRVVRTP